MVYFELAGENDFASIFPSVAESRKEENERQQTEMFLKLLDELEGTRDRGPPCNHRHNVEHAMAISGDGEIYDKDGPASFGPGDQKRVDRNKVHTLEDLPRETEWEMLFGAQPEQEPPIQVQTGLRLKDRKKVYRAFVPGEQGYFQWSGISTEALLMAVLVGLVVILILMRSRKRQRTNSRQLKRSRDAHLQLEHIIEAKVDRRVREHIRRIEITASDFC